MKAGIFFRGLLLLALMHQAWATDASDEEFETKQWQEIKTALPAAPQEGNLLPFYVSAIDRNQFLVDASSLTVGSDGVVRYVMVIVTPGGARNVTFEGMRCETREHKIYAVGHADGSWVKARSGDWRRIQEVAANGYHARLFLDYFCAGGVIASSPAEIVSALKGGGQARVFGGQ